MIFTSGTSGQPKGVVVSRAALSNLAQGEGQRFAIGPQSRVLLIAPPTTDPWICHVTGGLAAGATLVAASPCRNCRSPTTLSGNGSPTRSCQRHCSRSWSPVPTPTWR